LYFRKYDGNGEHTQRHPIDQPHTLITLDDGKRLCIQWLPEPAVFQVCWEDCGAIPGCAKEWKKARGQNDVKMFEMRNALQVLKSTISNLKDQDQEDPLIVEKLASTTKDLQDKKEQYATQCAKFQRLPTGEGWIKHKSFLAPGQAVVADFILTCEGQLCKCPAMLVITDSPGDISAKFPNIMQAAVKSTFDPDDEEDLEVSGEVFAPFLGPERSPYLASPSLPVIEQAKRARKNLRKRLYSRS
jgi:hypothetical protein